MIFSNPFLINGKVPYSLEARLIDRLVCEWLAQYLRLEEDRNSNVGSVKKCCEKLSAIEKPPCENQTELSFDDIEVWS